MAREDTEHPVRRAGGAPTRRGRSGIEDVPRMT
jgi:hypothetical protein